ncbi:MAG: NfeD family protein [Lachnospiraceae bacterium]|nr:NfeD family protein [Lachnospiraceae bacterium]
MDLWFWIGAFVVLIVIELLTVALTTIWFAGGALAAVIVSLCGFNLIWECVAFVVVSALLLLLVRPSVVRRFNKRRTKTNVEAIVGEEVRVVTPVDGASYTGRVVFNGMEWAAKSAREGVSFDVGEIAVVARVEGVKLLVNAKEETVC